MTTRARNTTKLNLPILIVTAIVSMLAWVGIYRLLIFMEDLLIADLEVRDFMTSGGYPVSIGAAFAGLLLVIGLSVLVLSSLMSTFRADILSGRLGKGRVILLFLVGILVIGCIAGVFQFIYQQDLVPDVKSTGDFIFLIDDSKSMLRNDPDLERYSALKAILEEQNPKTNFMVYSFASDVVLVHPMSTVEDGVPMLSRKELGSSTSYEKSLSQVIEDYNNGVWTAKNPMVIFFTDGVPMDIDSKYELTSVLERYAAANIPITTVGMGDVDTVMLEFIAEETGGSSLDIQEASAVSGAFRTAVSSFSSSRHLLSDRDTEGANLVYGALRVVMVSVLGILIGLLVALCYGNSGSFSLIVITSVIKSILAGLILEIGIVVLGLPDSLMSFFAVVLIGTVIARYGDPAARKVNGRMEYVSTRGSRRSVDAFDNFMD